jgi:hypothetical protein
MSTKAFCDLCGEELKKRDHDRVRRALGRVSVEVLTAVDGTWNGGHVCHRCVMQVVRDGKDVKGAVK